MVSFFPTVLPFRVVLGQSLRMRTCLQTTVDLKNRRKHNLVYRDVEGVFISVRSYKRDQGPAFVDWMIKMGFAIRRLYLDIGILRYFEVKTKSSTFRTLGRALTQEEFDVLQDDIRSV